MISLLLLSSHKTVHCIHRYQPTHTHTHTQTHSLSSPWQTALTNSKKAHWCPHEGCGGVLGSGSPLWATSWWKNGLLQGVHPILKRAHTKARARAVSKNNGAEQKLLKSLLIGDAWNIQVFPWNEAHFWRLALSSASPEDAPTPTLVPLPEMWVPPDEIIRTLGICFF